MAIRRCVRAAKKVAYRGSSGSFANRARTCVGHRTGCFPGLFSWLGHSDQVAANRRRGRSYVRCGLEEIWAAFDPALSAIVVALHTISHLTVSGLIAWLVYNFVGLAVLRHTWINVDLIWCCSLLGAGAVLLFVPIA
jgi:hypothetical protein